MMTVKDDDKMHAPAMKTEAPKAAPVEPPKAPPTQEELAKAFEELVVRAEAAGERDVPAVAKARDMLDRQPKKEEKNASRKG